MSRLVARTVNKKQVETTLRKLKLPAEHSNYIVEKMEIILKCIQKIERDIEADKVNDLNGLRPQARREQMLKIARSFDLSKKNLNVFRGPTLRHHEMPEFPRTRPVGLAEFRKAMSSKFSDVLSAEFIGKFGLKPLQWSPNSKNYHLNEENRSATIELIAEEIIYNLLGRLADAMRDAEKQLARNTPKGGPRPSKIRDFILINIVAIWRDISGSEKKISYNRGQTRFFEFCNGICIAIGAGNLCTEAHLRAAVAQYKILNNLP